MGCGGSKAASADVPDGKMMNPVARANGASHHAGGGGGGHAAHGHGHGHAGGSKKFEDNWQIGQFLGKGQFAEVFKAVSRVNRSLGEVAVKRMDKAKMTAEDTAALVVEIEAMKILSGHPNFVAFYDHFEDSKHVYLVMELISGGELFDRIVSKQEEGKPYTEREARELVRQLTLAMQHAHNKGVAHRDLKPENILLRSREDDSNIKIADLGFAKIVSAASPFMSTPCGTPGYVAPEILSGKPYTCAVDMWSLGVIFYILMCGYPPFASDDQAELFEMIKAARFEFDPREWSIISEPAKDLIRRILVADPVKRISADGIMRHPWMTAEQSAIPAMALEGSVEQLKRFQARRRLKNAMNTVRSTVRMKIMMAAKTPGPAGGAPSGGLAGAMMAAARTAKAQDSPRTAAMP